MTSVIRIDEIPTTPTWQLEPLYKESATGGLMLWQVGWNGRELEMTHGYVDGAIRTDRTEVKVNKSGRNLQEQALSDARSRYKLMFTKKGYRPAGAEPPEIETPALADKWIPDETTIRWPVLVQPKLDGIRMLARLVPDTQGGYRVRFRSRGNLEYHHFNRIADQLMDFFAYFPVGTEFDGELYTHDMTFEQLTSAVRTVKRKHHNLDRVNYVIFDIILPQDKPAEQRYIQMVNAYNRYLADLPERPDAFSIIPASYAATPQEAKDYHQRAVGAGYEGIILRRIRGYDPTPEEFAAYKKKALAKHKREFKKLQKADPPLSAEQLQKASVPPTDEELRRELEVELEAPSLYKPGRSSNLLKYKEFEDEEATVVDVKEAEGTEKGTAILVLQDERDNVFPVRPRGSFEQRAQWLQHPELVLGKRYTFRYQELSEYGVPRFPVGIGLRDYE